MYTYNDALIIQSHQRIIGDMGLRTIELTDDECGYLHDILTMWIDGYEDANQRQLTDEAVPDFETLLQLSSGLSEQEDLARKIRSKLESVKGGV